MKVGIERKRAPKNEDMERVWASTKCIVCEQERTPVYLMPYKKTSMRVCTNPKCYMYCNIDDLTSWQR